MTLSALTTYPDLWAAGVDIVGIANFVTFLENTGPCKLREPEYGSLGHDRAFLDRFRQSTRLIALPRRCLLCMVRTIHVYQ